jgi:transposase
MSDVDDKLVDLITEAIKRGRKSKASEDDVAGKSSGVEIRDTAFGDGAMIAGRDININRRQVKRTVVQTTQDHIAPDHKQKIKEKIAEIVDMHAKTADEKSELFAFWWGRLQKRFRVNSYHELSRDQYPAVLTWLNQQISMSLPKIRRKDNDAWRTKIYRSIWSKARSMGVSKEWMYDLVLQRIGKKVDSLTKLGERDLSKLHDIMKTFK